MLLVLVASDTYEGGGHVVRELHGDDGEGGSEESCVAHRLHYTNHEGQDDEGIVTFHSVQHPVRCF